MSSETTTRKKRPSPDTNLTPEGDHRKRRRNRTTQSCLNCHTSKRMCDRKRPACARCTQLGLTGLCVYEVDDPNQRSDSQDESARLLKRVAELEGVIRELKNKPHPRWVQAANGTNPELDKWTSRSHLRASSESSQDQVNSNAPSPPSSLKSEASSSSGNSARSLSLAGAYPPTILLNTSDRRLSQTASSSPQSTPSPALVTPTEEFSRSHISVAGQPEIPQEYDLASMFLTYPGLMGCDPASFGHLSKDSLPEESCFLKPSTGHCGCLHETSSYNAVLELSLRLRRAADILARSASHQVGHQCPLQQRISELDAFTTNTLGNVSMPPEDLPSHVISRQDGSHQSTMNNALQLQSSQAFGQPCRSLANTAISPESLRDLRSWDLLPTVTNSPTSCDDSFMSWEPPRRS